MRTFFLCFLSFVILIAAGRVATTQQAPPAGVNSPEPLDVCDVSYLWPAPKTAADVNALISVADVLADGKSQILSKDAFDAVLVNALQVQVKDSAGRPNQINFAQFATQFREMKNWKVAAIRIDPSAPGTSPAIASTIGSIPQIRLVVQPVTVGDKGVVTIHDTTAHVVFSYVLSGPPFVPDKQKFSEIVMDVRGLKQFLKDKKVSTAVPLGVHPGLTGPTPDFPAKLKGLLQKHLSEPRLSAIAFMGINPPEPWIFFSLDRTSGKWAPSNNRVVGGTGQMLIFRGGTPVCPDPLPLNLDGKRGVSTAGLFGVQAQKLEQAVFGDVPNLKFKDVPDFVANPARSHFFNTDCLSCHSESTRRIAIGLSAYKSDFRFVLPTGISGVDPNVAQGSQWNVRNFGWGDVSGVPTVTQRTANEAADSADFINKNYTTNPVAKVVSKPLTLVMTITGDKEFKELKALLDGMNADPKNPIGTALGKLGTVHFARFVFLDDRHLAVITTYDNDFAAYIDAFVNEIGPVFDELLKRMDGAPPLPVSDHRKEFLDYVQRNDRASASFYSAYPSLGVIDILTLQKKQQER
jgi:hypothetical protein